MRSLCPQTILFSFGKNDEIDPLETCDVLKSLLKRFREDSNLFRSSFHKVYENVIFLKIEIFHQNVPVDTYTDFTNLSKVLSFSLKNPKTSQNTFITLKKCVENIMIF